MVKKSDQAKIRAFWLRWANPTFGAHTLGSFLDNIAGGQDRSLTMAQLETWHWAIMYAVASMHARYEHRNVEMKFDMHAYYAPYWVEIEAAGEDKQKLLEAINELRRAIVRA